MSYDKAVENLNNYQPVHLVLPDNQTSFDIFTIQRFNEILSCYSKKDLENIQIHESEDAYFWMY